MKIGKLVRAYIWEIFEYCEKNPNELSNLMDKKYSKNKFGINFPFCMEVDSIPAVQASGKVSRFWKDDYCVCGKIMRVTSQWYKGSRPQFLRYLVDKNLINKENTKNLPYIDQLPNAESTVKTKHTQRSSSGKRYRVSALGNSQNAFVRNILGSLGDESFTEEDWIDVKNFFGNACAYCGKEGELNMEHAIPINKKQMGEHRIGNLVPSCRSCNNNKANTEYSEFLSNKPDRLEKINEHMRNNKYFPLKDEDNFEQLHEVFESAYRELGPLAARYIKILNFMIAKKE